MSKGSFMKAPSVQQIMIDLVSIIQLAKPDLLALFPIQRYIAIFDSQRLFGNYLTIPIPVIKYSQDICFCTNEGLLEIYHKLVLLTLIEQFEKRLSDRKIPQSIIELFYSEFSRIMDHLVLCPKGYYLMSNKQFLCDLAICRLKIYPCGPVLIDEMSGIPRSLLINNGLKQLLTGAIFFMFKAHGFQPFYELHMHVSQRKNFNAEGWLASYRKIAELLELNSNVRGVSCASWWYDPQLETISPRLAYLRNIPYENGAKIFYVQADKTAVYGAIDKSESRRQLFKAGTYIPKIYMMIWPRQALSSWANKQVSHYID
jgi:hypothetical protein